MTPPQFTYQCHNGKGFVLTSPWPVTVAEGAFIIPKGFITDLASIPRALWWIPGLAPFEIGPSGPIAHDAIYQGLVGRDLGVDRRRADEILRVFCRCDGVGRIRSFVVWAAVRMFGWLAWRRMPDRDRSLWMAR